MRSAFRLRTVALTLAVAAFLSLPGVGTAEAGVYTVKACSDGRADRWSANTSYYVGARIACPWSPQAGGGLTISTSGGPGFAAGSLAFTAPPGATVARMEGEVAITQANGWQAGIWDFEHSRWLYCGPGNPCNTFGSFYPFAFDNFRSTQLGPLVICGGSACNGGGAVTLKNVTTFIEDFSPPGLAVNVPGGWLRGTQAIGVDANDNVGIKRTELLVDGGRRARADRECDQFRAIPCPNGGGSLDLNTADRLSDGRHVTTLQAVDSADNPTSIDRPIFIDNTAPGQIGEPVVEGGDGWRSTNAFSLSWLTPAQPGVAPVAAVEYELCPSERKSGDPACRRGARPAADFGPASTGRSVLKDVAVPGPGAWTVKLWLRDEAGNQNADTARTLTLRFDDVPPILAIRPLDPADPTRLRVQGSDTPSGIARAVVELQRRGETAWRPLDAQLEDGGFAVSLDDENLPDGGYALRARAVDQAGNERSTDQFVDGRSAEIALPVRITTQLAVGEPKRVRIKRRPKGSKRRYRTTLLKRPSARYGRSVRLQGRLTTPGQNALPDTEVQVSELVDVPGASPRPIGTVTTSRTGRFSYRLPKGPSRMIRFRYGGTRTIRAGTGEVALRVLASTSFAVDRRRVVNGQSVTFRGHLRGGNIPAEGKLVALQAYTRGRWRPFATARAAAATGRWDYTYRFDGTRGVVRYRFRARLLREATYPFTTGTSVQQRVVVRGIK